MLETSEDIYRAKAIINQVSASTEQCDELFKIFIAMAAAQSVPLPTERQSDLGNWIVENKTDVDIGRYIARVNEVCIIDYKRVRRLASQFYTFRYAMAYGGLDSMAFAMAAFTGVSGDIVVSDARDALNAVRDNDAVNDAFNLAMRIALKD